MREAILYQKLQDQKVLCNVCHQHCVIKIDARGKCGVRANLEGTLYALNYGKAIAVAMDPVEKKPLYHFLPDTKTYSFAAVGCNLTCSWCQNWEISQSVKPNNIIDGKNISPDEHVYQAIHFGCPSISYTYSEPTIFLEYAIDTMIKAHELGLKNIWVTNGYMTKDTLELIIPYLDAANVDFKGPDDLVYKNYCNGHASFVMDNLIQLHFSKVHLEITTLIVPGVNDQPSQLEDIANFIALNLGVNVPWHISRFFPAWKMLDKPYTSIETMYLARDIGYKAGLKIIHLGNVY